MNNEKTTVEVNEAWFERLKEIAEKVENKGKVDMQALSMLLGYIESVDFILKKRMEKTGKVTLASSE